MRKQLKELKGRRDGLFLYYTGGMSKLKSLCLLGKFSIRILMEYFLLLPLSCAWGRLESCEVLFFFFLSRIERVWILV